MHASTRAHTQLYFNDPDFPTPHAEAVVLSKRPCVCVRECGCQGTVDGTTRTVTGLMHKHIWSGTDFLPTYTLYSGLLYELQHICRPWNVKVTHNEETHIAFVCVRGISCTNLPMSPGRCQCVCVCVCHELFKT